MPSSLPNTSNNKLAIPIWYDTVLHTTTPFLDYNKAPFYSQGALLSVREEALLVLYYRVLFRKSHSVADTLLSVLDSTTTCMVGSLDSFISE